MNPTFQDLQGYEVDPEKENVLTNYTIDSRNEYHPIGKPKNEVQTMQTH